MLAKKLIPTAKINWLREIGVDTYWLDASDNAKSANTPVIDQAQAPKVATYEQPAVAPVTPKDQNIAVNHGNLDQINSISALYQAFTQDFADLNQPFVFGMGPEQSPQYMIIGDQPGLDDEIIGKPFQGDQGILLQAILTSTRLPTADSCFMSYLFKYRLASGQHPGTDLIANNLAYLKREIELIQPENLIILGKYSARALLGLGTDASLTGIRGKRHTYQLSNGTEIGLWLSYPPAALLVYGSRKEQAWRDFVSIARYNN